MNEPRFEVVPEMGEADHDGMGTERFPTGEFCWHFKDANGHITFTGEESFTRREDAHRSIEGAGLDAIVALTDLTREEAYGSLLAEPPIIDLDENGDVIDAEGKP